jgi:long-chain-fatty-acid--CoA ligase ACSBG
MSTANNLSSTLPEAFQHTAERHGSRTALVQYRPNACHYTYAEYYEACVDVARALVALGVEPGATVAIFGSNSPKYLIAYWGALLAGVLPYGIYPTSSEASCRQLLELGRCVVAFGEDGDCGMRLVAAAAAAAAAFPDLKLKHLVLWPSTATSPDDDTVSQTKTFASMDTRVMSWHTFLNAGCSLDDGNIVLMHCHRAQNADQAALIVFTSGTSGTPKAVALSHRNVLFVIESARRLVQFDETWRGVSYLPLSHVAATMLDIIGPAIVGFSLHFADPDVLQPGSRSLVRTLRAVRPDFFVGVPRVWERIAEQLQEVAASQPAPIRHVSTWAKRVMFSDIQRWEYPQADWCPSWSAWLADRLVLWPIRRALGLDRARILISSAAPLGPETLDYFSSLGMRICDLYGMTECTGPIAINLPRAYRRGSSGRPLPGTCVRVDAETSELQVQGSHVFKAYFNDPASTAVAFTSDGFFRTGDLATIDRDGFIWITGRLKELIVTAGGENIAPAPLERALESAMPAVARAMVIGDRRKFLSCLLSLQTAPDGETLIGEAAAVDDATRTAADASAEAAVLGTPWNRYVEQGLAKANRQAVSRAAQVRKAWIVPRAFSVEDQTLTPTLKLRRAFIEARYAAQIQRLYAGG